MENLRYMLLPYKPSEPIYFGCRFKPYVKQGYMSGGAGYVLSKEAVRRLVEVNMCKIYFHAVLFAFAMFVLVNKTTC